MNDRVDSGKQFWTWFSENCERMREVRTGQEPIFGELTERLQSVHQGLVWEMGKAKDGSFEFTISADGIREVIPEVQALMACAPELPGWKKFAFRQRDQRAGAKLQVDGRLFDPSSVYYISHEAGDQIDVIAFMDGLTQENMRQYMGACFVLMDQQVGEFDAMTRIRAFRLLPLSQANGTQRPLTELPNEIDALKRP